MESNTPPDPLDYVLECLAATDISPLPNDLTDHTKTNIRRLLTKIQSLPTTTEGCSVFAVLPKEKVPFLPRALPVPTPKAKTRWEKFSEEKNIHKKKRAALVWDATEGGWARRWGYRSVKQNASKAQGIIEVKPGQDPFVDPFEQQSVEKALVKSKQKFREIRNKMEGAGYKKPTNKTSGSVAPLETKIGKSAMRDMFDRATRATASFGRHDPASKTDSRKSKLPLGYKRKVTFKKNRREEQDGYKETLESLQRRSALESKLKVTTKNSSSAISTGRKKRKLKRKLR